MITDPAHAEASGNLARELDAAAASDRRSEAVELFLTRVVQMPPPVVAQMKSQAMWKGLERIAHTLAYDVRITARGPARSEQLRAIAVPTLVIAGAASPAWMRDAAQSLARAIPNGKHRTLEGQTHNVDPKALAQAMDVYLRE